MLLEYPWIHPSNGSSRCWRPKWPNRHQYLINVTNAIICRVFFGLISTRGLAWRRGRYRARINLKDLEILTKYGRLCNSFHNFFSQVKLASDICMWHFHTGRRFITKPSKRLHSIFCIEYQKFFSWHSAFDISNPVFIKCFEFGVSYGPWIPDQFLFWNWIALKSIMEF